MKARVWLGENSRDLFIEDLRGEQVQLTDYGQAYDDGENQTRILEGMLPDAGWISKFQGKFEFNNNGIWVPKERRGNFIVGEKVLKTSRYGEDRSPSAIHVYVNNHPFYTPGGFYFTTSLDVDYLGTKSLEEKMREEGIPARTRIELIGSDTDDIIYRIFQTYVDPVFVNPAPATRSPPLLLYELVA